MDSNDPGPVRGDRRGGGARRGRKNPGGPEGRGRPDPSDEGLPDDGDAPAMAADRADLARQDGGRQDGGQAPAPRPMPRPAAEGQRPVASVARVKRRHSGIFLSFVVLVGLPVLLVALYLYVFAQDQYASTTGFTVRSNETSSASELVGGLSSIVGGGSSTDADVLYAFVHSQQIVESVQAAVDLRAHYSETWRTDPFFSIWPDATIEDLQWFWNRVVIVSYDQNSGLMDVQVRARTAEMAQQIARIIVEQSEQMINALNAQAREDATSNAQRDLDEALERLRLAREEMASFRARTQILDPQADIAGRMGVINGLQTSLATALVDYDLLIQTTADTDPRVRQAERRIEVIRQRIAEERQNFATQDVTVFGTDYPRLIAQFEGLVVNQEFAERTYTAALEALDVARSNAERQSLYLATYIRPTLAEQAEYPRRILLIFLSAFFLTMGWGALALIYYSLRDRG